jgi:hypothetical protein
MKTKMTKLFLVGILVASLSLSSSITFAQESDNTLTASDRENIISKLLNAGFTLQQINDFPESELLTYKDGEIVSADTRYYRISYKKAEKKATDGNNEDQLLANKSVEGTREVTELTKEQCFNEVQEYNKKHNQLNSEKDTSTSGIATTMSSYDDGTTVTTDTDGWLSMNLVAVYKGGTKYKLSAECTWLTNPDCTQIDVMGLGHDDGLTQTNDAVTSWFKDDYRDFWNNRGTDTNTTPNNLTVDSGGTVASYELNSHDASHNGGYYRENYRCYISYYANVNSTTIRYVSVYGKYAHQQAIVTISPSIAWPLSAGFSVSSSYKFDFLSPNPYFSLHVNY